MTESKRILAVQLFTGSYFYCTIKGRYMFTWLNIPNPKYMNSPWNTQTLPTIHSLPEITKSIPEIYKQS